MRYAWWLVSRGEFIMPEPGYMVKWTDEKECVLAPLKEGYRVHSLMGTAGWREGRIEAMRALPQAGTMVLNLGWYPFEEDGRDVLRVFPFLIGEPFEGKAAVPKPWRKLYGTSREAAPHHRRTIYDLLTV
jgi:hypothetical protein